MDSIPLLALGCSRGGLTLRFKWRHRFKSLSAATRHWTSRTRTAPSRSTFAATGKCSGCPLMALRSVEYLAFRDWRLSTTVRSVSCWHGGRLNPHKNPALIEKYRLDNPHCELAWCTDIPAMRLGMMAEQTHHLFSMHMRPDYLSNIIRLSWHGHNWCHVHPIDGRILCMLVKARKRELDPDEFKIAAGVYPAGWLSRSVPTLDWMSPYAEELRVLLA